MLILMVLFLHQHSLFVYKNQPSQKNKPQQPGVFQGPGQNVIIHFYFCLDFICNQMVSALLYCPFYLRFAARCFENKCCRKIWSLIDWGRIKSFTWGKPPFRLGAVTICLQAVLHGIDVEGWTLIHQFCGVTKFLLLNLSSSFKVHTVCGYVFMEPRSSKSFHFVPSECNFEYWDSSTNTAV